VVETSTIQLQLVLLEVPTSEMPRKYLLIIFTKKQNKAPPEITVATGGGVDFALPSAVKRSPGTVKLVLKRSID
jgi:hypothetical protein